MSATGTTPTVSGVGEPPLKAWPKEERPRERLLAKGARDLADTELLAVMLRSGTASTSAVALARRLQALAQARGGYAGLEWSDLHGLPGMGPAKAAGLLAAWEWGRRQALKTAPSRLAGPSMALDALRPLLAGRREEHVAVLALDARHRVLAAQLVSQGCLTSAMAHPREVFRAAVKLGAAAVVVGHNHPSGDPSPSPDDHALTRRLRGASEVLGIPLLDHVIVGDSAAFSYADSGWPA